MFGRFLLFRNLVVAISIMIGITIPINSYAFRAYLTCDPPPEGEWVEWYEVQGLPGYEGRKIPFLQPVSRRVADHVFYLDVTDMPKNAGTYSVTAIACNRYECSDPCAPLILNVSEGEFSKGRVSGKFVSRSR